MSYTAWSLVYGEQPSTAKWNILGTNDAHIYNFLGANVAWQSWTPTLTNLTIGNGTLTCAYTQVGKTVIGRFTVLFGTTTSMGTIPTFSLPVTASSTTFTGGCQGMVMLKDANAGSFLGVLFATSTTVMAIYAYNASSTYALTANITSTVPFTWATNDYIAGMFSYEAA